MRRVRDGPRASSARNPGRPDPIGALRALDRGALREVWSVVLWSRLVVLGLTLFVWLRLTPEGQVGRPPNDLGNAAAAFDGWPLEGLFEALFEPLAIWDAKHYIRIAESGYGGGPPADVLFPATRPAFFPLYPALVRLLSGWAASTGAVVVAAYVVSFVSFVVALYLLHRLVELDLGRAAARPTLLLMAFSPAAFVFVAPYTESLFLLATVGAVYAARTGHWTTAALLAAGASGTRNSGVLIAVALGLMYLYGPRSDGLEVERRRGRLFPRYRLRPDAAWLALAPLGLAAYMAYLAHAVGDPFAWTAVQEIFRRETTGPAVGLWRSVREGVEPLLGPSGVEPQWDALNVSHLLLLVAVLGALVGMFRRLPVPYAVYALLVLVGVVSAPWDPVPLFSLPRYLLVVFPLFMWLGLVCSERRATAQALAAMAAAMALLAVQFAYGGLTV